MYFRLHVIRLYIFYFDISTISLQKTISNFDVILNIFMRFIEAEIVKII